MDFHGLTRKELQTLCKKNKIPANMTNIAMADALAALQYVEGLDELLILNQSSQSQEKVAPETPSVVVNRTKPKKEDPETAQALTRTRRATRKTTDQEDKNVAETPAASTCTSRRKTQVAASSVGARTRQSVRLLEKTMVELSLKGKARAEPVPVKMDFLDQTHESDNLQQKNSSDDDDDYDKEANTDETEPVDVSVTEDDASEEVMRLAGKVSDETEPVDVSVTEDDASGEVMRVADKVSDETEPVDVSVMEDDASGEVMCVADKVSDEITAKVTDDVDVEADQREVRIIALQQLKIERGTELDSKNLEDDSNECAGDASDTDDDDDLDSQKFILVDEAGSNQVASKESASEADDSDSRESVANQQQVNLIAEADSNQFSTAADVSSASDTDADDDSDSQKSILVDEAGSNQVASKESACEADADADDDSDSHESVANQQVNLIAEAHSNQFTTTAAVSATDDDSDSQKSVAGQLETQTTVECVEELVDVSLMEAYEEEIPNSNSAKRTSPSSPENTMKNLVNVYVMPAEEFGMAAPAIAAKQMNDCQSAQSASNQVDNKENIDSSGIMKVESKNDKVKKKSNNIVDEDSDLKSLNEKSLRQLNKMLKEKLQISNNKRNNEEQNITKKQVGNKPRPALQTLTENQMLAGGGEPNNES